MTPERLQELASLADGTGLKSRAIKELIAEIRKLKEQMEGSKN